MTFIINSSVMSVSKCQSDVSMIHELFKYLLFLKVVWYFLTRAASTSENHFEQNSNS